MKQSIASVYIMCAAIRCENLQAPRYGSVKQSGSTVGSQGVYDCNKGFTLKGNKIRKCLFNGQWSGSQPVCKSKIIQYVCMCVWWKFFYFVQESLFLPHHLLLPARSQSLLSLVLSM